VLELAEVIATGHYLYNNVIEIVVALAILYAGYRFFQKRA
jgi:hypothetical protein